MKQNGVKCICGHDDFEILEKHGGFLDFHRNIFIYCRYCSLMYAPTTRFDDLIKEYIKEKVEEKKNG